MEKKIDKEMVAKKRVEKRLAEESNDLEGFVEQKKKQQEAAIEVRIAAAAETKKKA